jgi:uncharacterized protein YlxW (UPF0749 family)
MGATSQQTRRAEQARPARRPDASMSLLTGLMSSGLDDDYAQVKERRRANDPARKGHGRRSSVGAATALVLLGLFFAAAVAQIRDRDSGPGSVRDELVLEVRERTAEQDALRGALEELRSEVAALRNEQIPPLQSGVPVTRRLDDLEVATGAVRTAGPGLEIIVEDAPETAGGGGVDPRAERTFDEGRVLDGDLQLVVNGLWAAGAEAVAINGHRLTALVAIRRVGDAILVDYQPVRQPYVISAIGPPEGLETGFAESAGGLYLRFLADNVGIRFSVSQEPELVLPGATSVRLLHAQPPENGSQEPTSPGEPTTSLGEPVTSLGEPASSPGALNSEGPA